MIHINDTLRFVLPILYSTEYNLDKEFFLNPFFVGAYTSDFRHPEFDDSLILVYTYFPTEEYIEFENKLKSLLNPIIYNEEDSDRIFYVIDIPDDYNDDYSLIMANVFDKLSPQLKLKITKMWDLSEEDGLFRVILGFEDYDGAKFEDEIINLNTEKDVENLL